MTGKSPIFHKEWMAPTQWERQEASARSVGPINFSSVLRRGPGRPRKNPLMPGNATAKVG
jgi:hypothetical protein